MVSMMLAPGWRYRITQHRALAVDEAEVAQVLDGIHHLGDVREPHRRAVAIGDDEVAVVRRPVLAWSLV